MSAVSTLGLVPSSVRRDAEMNCWLTIKCPNRLNRCREPHERWKSHGARLVSHARPAAEDRLRHQHVRGVVIAAARYEQTAEYLAIGTDANHQTLAAKTLFPVASVRELATALTLLRPIDAGAALIPGGGAYPVGGGPNHLLSASARPTSVPSPTHAT
jgi:hypothetical protein